VLTPIPGADRTLRMFTFLDGGWVWGPDQSVNFKICATRPGFGIAWISPMGRMKFSYGYPAEQQADRQGPSASSSRSAPASEPRRRRAATRAIEFRVATWTIPR